jgi:hypothetical protein
MKFVMNAIPGTKYVASIGLRNFHNLYCDIDESCGDQICRSLCQG